jgi:hypothetical protein
MPARRRLDRVPGCGAAGNLRGFTSGTDGTTCLASFGTDFGCRSFSDVDPEAAGDGPTTEVDACVLLVGEGWTGRRDCRVLESALDVEIFDLAFAEEAEGPDVNVVFAAPVSRRGRLGCAAF